MQWSLKLCPSCWPVFIFGIVTLKEFFQGRFPTPQREPGAQGILCTFCVASLHCQALWLWLRSCPGWGKACCPDRRDMNQA